MDYPIVVNRLSDEDGGGYLAHFPDLMGCMSDGETPEEAVSNALLAFDEWMDAAKTRNVPIPQPHSAAARAQREREGLFAAIRDLSAHHDRIDDQLAELRRRITEIEEQIAHNESWDRLGIVSDQELPLFVTHRTVLISG